MRTASAPRRAEVPALLLALALIVGLPAYGGAQQLSRAAVGASRASPPPPVGPIALLPVFPETAGAVVGWALGASFRDSFCDEPRPGYSCTTTNPAVGALAGAAVGALAGAILWTISSRVQSPPRAGSR